MFRFKLADKEFITENGVTRFASEPSSSVEEETSLCCGQPVVSGYCVGCKEQV